MAATSLLRAVGEARLSTWATIIGGLVTILALEGDAAERLRVYCTFIVASYALFGLQLAANPLFTALRIRYSPRSVTCSGIVASASRWCSSAA